VTAGVVSLSAEITPALAGARLDRALATLLPDLSRERVKALILSGHVLGPGGKPVSDPALKVKADTAFALEIPEAAPAEAVAQQIDLVIPYEDEHLIVIDKPAGMVVHAGPGHASGSLVNAVLHHLGNASLPVLPGNGPERPGLVHRLDRDTSGLIVVAKTMPALAALAEQLRAHTIERAYLGVVLGDPSWDTLRVETRHGRDPTDRRRFSPEHGERRAITNIAVIQRLGEQASLLRFVLETGRTHQIRMHARHVGHPIFADALYGRRPKDARLRALADELGRHALHAAVLGFDHPDGGARLRFESKLPPELVRLVAGIVSIYQ
jgi:23S rRNA pseudouridine1911/1915/1917 synthase